ncbi:beta-N-acetylhexosaminidase [Chitinophaga ginsengisegetis]|uniref:glycoside hydrolase family 20 zincin-like fold domain-containing protein n=1 Tax=Chitinophaga ginsengisegetis TaxID=393003 RepID=UPI0034356C5F
MKNNIAKLLFVFFEILLIVPVPAFSSLPGRPPGGDEANLLKHFRLVPLPQKIVLAKGAGLACNALGSIFLEGIARRPVLQAPLSTLPDAERPGEGVLTLRLKNDPSLPASREGYKLEVTARQVVITAKSEAGIFYGCQTLQQLLEDARDQSLLIPACTITDFPEIPYRAVHLDLKYHLDNLDYYYRLMDRLAAVKVNAVILEFEDKLRYRSAPVIGAENSISIDEFAALSRYANERHIEISPLVQGLGHVAFILKHDEYVGLRDDPRKDWVFDPLDSGTYALQFRLYDEAIAATPNGKYLHVGGDEVYNLGRSAASRKSGMTTFQLQMYWLNKVCAYAREHNRIPVFWDDMIFSLSGLYMSMHDTHTPADSINLLWEKNAPKIEQYLHLFPKDCIYMRWHYTYPRLQGNQNAVNWLKSHQLKVMGASAVQEMHPMMPRNQSLFNPIKDFSWVAVTHGLEGMLATAWDDSSPHFETFWRGIYDYAWLSWKYTDIGPDEAHAAFRHRFYGPALSNERFEFQDSLEFLMNFQDTAFVKNSTRITVPEKIDLIELPGSELPADVWRTVYRNRVNLARKEIKRYETTRGIIKDNIKLARRNHYALRLFERINELQIYNAKILDLLDDYAGETTPDGRQRAVLKIRSAADGFADLRKEYEQVFSETRFLERPPGYLMDDNYDTMLANATQTSSDWMYLFELKMNVKLEAWLKSMQ